MRGCLKISFSNKKTLLDLLAGLSVYIIMQECVVGLNLCFFIT